MKRIARVTAAAALAAALTVAAGPTPAGAGQTLYKWQSCPAGTSTTGQIDSTHVLEPNIGGDHPVWVQGVFNLCAKVRNNYTAFALAGYTDTTATGQSFRLPLNAQQFAYGAILDVTPDVRALCIIVTESHRVACVSVAWQVVDGVAQPVVDGPLPVDAPLVSRPVTINLALTEAIPPQCPGCGG